MQTTVTASAGDKATFYRRTSYETGDRLEFYLDETRQDRITGNV